MATDPIPSRLANLPGYDTTAPDIYATPDDDDASPRPQSRSPPSETSDDDDDDDDDSTSSDDAASAGVGILSRRRLYPERARRRFEDSRALLGSRGLDLSDRVDGRRRGYAVRRRSGSVEGLEARIARLRREVEEVRVLAGREEGAEEEGQAQAEELGRLLAGVRVRGGRGGGARMEEGEGEGEGEGESDGMFLKRVAHFDTRLAALEQALGVGALFDSNSTDAHASTPVLPTLALLDQQLAALSSSTSLANLETASSRLRSQADARRTSSPDTADSPPEDRAKLQSLYALLPTLQSLSPTVPALLARLHSLRTLHAGAAAAASQLEDVERSQAEMERELKAWKDGLEKVERAVAQADEANGRNGKVVEGWVRELEGRMKKLGR